MKISVNKKVQEKMIILSIIGCLDAIKEQKMSIDEAEVFLFLPRMCSILEREGYSKKIIHIIELGCELEDVESLLPERLDFILDDIKKESLDLLDSYDNCENMYWLEE